MKHLNIEEKLKSMNLTVFTPREFKSIFDLSAKTASVYLSRNLKSGLFIKLRNSFYILKDSRPSPYFIANKLYQPSYLSLEKALSYYQIIPETVYGMTSVTTKSTREFATPNGLFIYQRIKREAFTGYFLKIIDGDNTLIAEPEKALADYLYFVDLKKIPLSDRLNLQKISKKKLLGYANLFRRKSLMNLINRIYD